MQQPATSRQSGLILGILDLCKRTRERSARQSLEETIALAELADELGYRRFWVAEHHTEDSAEASPEVLVALIASRTRRIRAGSGGVLLRYYSPFKVAETFLTIEALFPGRIDLGVAKGPGITVAETAAALVDGNEWELRDDVFDRKVHDLVCALRAAPPASESDAQTAVPRPWGVPPPPVWVLGSGTKSAMLAAGIGAPYALALFFPGWQAFGPELVAEYRRTFRPGPESAGARVMIAVSVACAATEALAARRHENLVARGFYESTIVGTPVTCAGALREIAGRFGADELLVTTWFDDQAERCALYRDLARECGLTPRRPDGER